MNTELLSINKTRKLLKTSDNFVKSLIDKGQLDIVDNGINRKKITMTSVINLMQHGTKINNHKLINKSQLQSENNNPALKWKETMCAIKNKYDDEINENHNQDNATELISDKNIFGSPSNLNCYHKVKIAKQNNNGKSFIFATIIFSNDKDMLKDSVDGVINSVFDMLEPGCKVDEMDFKLPDSDFEEFGQIIEKIYKLIERNK